MPNLIIKNDQAAATGRVIKQFESGLSAIDVLMRAIPNGIDQDKVSLYINADLVDLNDEVTMTRPLCENDRVTIVNEVKGVETLVYIAIAVVAAAVAIALVPDPALPNGLGEQKQSPNNQLSGQSNIARTYQSWPLILGSPVSYPDLIGEAIEEYSDNIKQVEQYFFVGFGQFDIAQVRTGQTPLYNFPSATYQSFQPTTASNTVLADYMTSFALEEVDGQILKATNETQAGTERKSTIDGSKPNDVDSSANTAVFYLVQNSDMDLLKSEFDTNGSFNATISYTAFIEIPSQGQTEDIIIPQIVSGSGLITNIELVGSNYKISFSSFNGPESDSGLYPSDSSTISTGFSGQINNINTPVECEEIWINFSFQRGLKAFVDISITITELDAKNGNPTANTSTATQTYSQDTLNPQYRTLKLATPAGKSWYRISIKRTNSSPQLAEKPDETRLEKVQCINKYTNKSFGNGTVLKVNIPATENAASTRSTKINLSLTALTPTYNTATKTVDTTLRASRRMADAVLHTYTNYYDRPASELDLDALYEIQERIEATDPTLVNFDFTFDDGDISLSDRLETILNVARCYTWQSGNVWRFKRDEARGYPVALIGRRDIASEGREYSLNYSPTMASNFDGVRVEYVDRLINKKAYVYRSVVAGGIAGTVSRNPKVIQLAGCQSISNANNRADLEIRKLIYQRETITETTLQSMSLLERGDRVLYAEQYESDIYDGEVLGSGPVENNLVEIKTSEIQPVGEAISIEFTNQLGEVSQKYNAVVNPDDGRKISVSAPAGINGLYIRDDDVGYLIQTGSRYIARKLSDPDNTNWTITDIEPRERNVQLTMVNYNQIIYEMD